jgi:protein FrlC
MKLSFNTWAYSSFPVWIPAYTLEETIKRIAAIGYDGIEIGAAAPHAYPAHLSKGRRKEIKTILDDNGITVSSMLPAPGGGPGFSVASPLVEGFNRRDVEPDLVARQAYEYLKPLVSKKRPHSKLMTLS